LATAPRTVDMARTGADSQESRDGARPEAKMSFRIRRAGHRV